MFSSLRGKLTTKKEIILKAQYSSVYIVFPLQNSKSCIYFLMQLSTTNTENWTCLLGLPQNISAFGKKPLRFFSTKMTVFRTIAI